MAMCDGFYWGVIRDDRFGPRVTFFRGRTTTLMMDCALSELSGSSNFDGVLLEVSEDEFFEKKLKFYLKLKRRVIYGRPHTSFV